MRTAIFLLVFSNSLLAICGVLTAAEPTAIELTIEPRAVEAPVLKYQLLPTEPELKSGNAVPILLRLPWEQTEWMSKTFPTLHEWDDRPLNDAAWANFSGVVPENFYNEMKRAAFRRDAHWEYPLGETQTPYLILLPDVQGLRGFLGYGLSAKIRYHLSRGELSQARECILVGLANSRHIAQTPFYVNQLVALAIARIMLERTGELVSQPNSPNLYWALSTLPNSLIELHRAASLEGNIFAITFPAAKDLDHHADAKEWSKMARQLVELLELIGEIRKLEKPNDQGSVIEQFLQRLNLTEKNRLSDLIQHARGELPELLKVSAEKVASMSEDEVAVRWYVFKRLSRDQLSSAALVMPPGEAWPLLKKLRAENAAMREKLGSSGEGFFDPASIYMAAWSYQRKVQSLRVIEAVRDYMATHDGHLPKSLDDIHDLPIPLDPLTGKAFEWSVDANVAVLKAPSLPADVLEPGPVADAQALIYRLRAK